MKLEMNRYAMKMIPENVQDVVYIEEVLRLREDKDTLPLRRANGIDLKNVACLETVSDDVVKTDVEEVHGNHQIYVLADAITRVRKKMAEGRAMVMDVEFAERIVREMADMGFYVGMAKK